MDHVAIMNKRWRLIEKILSGEKKIESRWYKTKRAPWNKIQKGDTVYFKNSGESITAKAMVSDVKFYFLHSNSLDRQQNMFKSIQDNSKHFLESTPKQIYKKYGRQIGLQHDEFKEAILEKTDKNYCILIWLKNPEKIEAFNVDKTGYGTGSAWISIKNIKKIRVD